MKPIMHTLHAAGSDRPLKLMVSYGCSVWSYVFNKRKEMWLLPFMVKVLTSETFVSVDLSEIM